jgi:hypothetical protein
MVPGSLQLRAFGDEVTAAAMIHAEESSISSHKSRAIRSLEAGRGSQQ